MSRAVSEHYCNGIREGREQFRREGSQFAADHLDNLNRTIKGFATGSPVGDMLRGERDFWRHQIANRRTADAQDDAR